MPLVPRLRAGSIALALLLVAGCGSGDDPAAEEPADDEAADEPATETTDEPAAETTAAPLDEPGDEAGDDSDDDPATDDLVVIDDLDDLPDGCVDLFVDFMKDIEPSVEGIDFETATLADLSTIGERVQESSDEFGTRSQELGCEQYDPQSEDTVYRELLDLARREAPGAVGFYEFLNSLAAGSAPDAPAGESAATCADALATVDEFVAEYETYNDVPMSELEALGSSMSALTAACTIEATSDFFARDDISEFFSG